MAYEIRIQVISPEAGIQKIPGDFSAAIGANPAASGRIPPGAGSPTPVSTSAAKRLDTLENKTVYLVDTGFGGSYNFMLQLQKWFKDNMPSVTTLRKRKPGNVFADDNDSLWEEIREKGDAAVVGVAG